MLRSETKLLLSLRSLFRTCSSWNYIPQACVSSRGKVTLRRACPSFYLEKKVMVKSLSIGLYSYWKKQSVLCKLCLISSFLSEQCIIFPWWYSGLWSTGSVFLFFGSLHCVLGWIAVWALLQTQGVLIPSAVGCSIGRANRLLFLEVALANYLSVLLLTSWGIRLHLSSAVKGGGWSRSTNGICVALNHRETLLRKEWQKLCGTDVTQEQ